MSTRLDPRYRKSSAEVASLMWKEAKRKAGMHAYVDGHRLGFERGWLAALCAPSLPCADVEQMAAELFRPFDPKRALRP